MFREAIKNELDGWVTLNGRFKKMFDELTSENVILKEVFENHIKMMQKEFAKKHIDISEYITNRNYNGAEVFDYKLTMLLYMMNNYNFKASTAEHILKSFVTTDDAVFEQIVLLCAANINADMSIEEIKLGLEEGLNINEIAVILGKNPENTHDNRQIYVRYKEFFRNKLYAGDIGGLKKCFIAARTEGYNLTPELILYAKTIDDLKVNAPVVKVTGELQTLITTEKINIAGAYYTAIGNDDAGEAIAYKCFCPRDKESFSTQNENEAQRWVLSKNNGVKYSVKQKNIIKNR